MNLNEKLLTLKEVAELLRISPNYAKVKWPEWTKSGVNPIRLNGSGRLLFKRSEIMQFVDSCRIIKD